MQDTHGFEKMLSNKLYMAGTFFQLDWFNPLYLDKTGLAIARTEGRLENWTGNLSAFQFSSVDGYHIGKVSIENYWFQKKEQEYFTSDMLSSVKKRIELDVADWSEVYEIRYLKRIGFRVQSILDKFSQPNIDRFNKIFESHIRTTSGSDLKTINAALELSDGPCTARLSVSWAVKQNEELPGPEKGFLLDVDLYRPFEKLPWTEEVGRKEVNDFFAYCDRTLLSHISNCLGMIGLEK